MCKYSDQLSLERCIIAFPRPANSVVQLVPQKKVVLSHCMKVSFVKTTRATNIEVVGLPSAVQLYLYFLVAVTHSGKVCRKFWTPTVLRITITVILECLVEVQARRNGIGGAMRVYGIARYTGLTNGVHVQVPLIQIGHIARE